MAFSFGFSGDDIDTSADQDITPEGNVGLNAGGIVNSSDSVQVTVQAHDLKEWVGEPFLLLRQSFSSVVSQAVEVSSLLCDGTIMQISSRFPSNNLCITPGLLPQCRNAPARRPQHHMKSYIIYFLRIYDHLHELRSLLVLAFYSPIPHFVQHHNHRVAYRQDVAPTSPRTVRHTHPADGRG